MADRYQSDYRSRQDRYQRGSGQAEQFQPSYDDDRSYNQMGESWRDQEGQQDEGWQSGQSRYDRGQQRGYGSSYGQRGGGDDYGSGYGSSYGGSSGRYGQRQGGGYGRDYQDRGDRSARGRGSMEGPSWDTSSGAGSQLARAHGEWHDRDRDRGRDAGWGRRSEYDRGNYDRSNYDRSRGDDRGFLERAGDKLASWLGDDDDYGRDRGMRQSYRGQGPANYKRSDERLLEDACEQLTHDHHVDARNIQVTVQGGELTLDGTVTSRDQKRRAEDIVEDLSGVKHVQNNLRVQQGSTWDRNNSGDRTQSGSTPGETSGTSDIGTTRA